MIESLRSSYEERKPLQDVFNRKEKLTKLLSIICDKEKDIKDALKKDLGKSAFESYLTEIAFIKDEIKFTLKHLKKWTRPKKRKYSLSTLPGKGYVYSDSYGVVLIISPWNYPFQLCFSPLIGAIAAGNHVALKPSEFTPYTANVIEEIIAKTFDSDEVIVFQGGVEVSRALLKEKFDYIFFTGSTQVGQLIMEQASKHLTPVTLELGGKSPCIVDRTSDLELSAKRIIWGKALNCGQTCVAPDYLYVHEDIYEDFVKKCGDVLRNFYQDHQLSSGDYGKIISRQHYERLKSLFTKEEVILGGGFDDEQTRLETTLINVESWDHPAMKEEIFGPILPVIKFRNFHDVVKQVNARPKPLAAYYFGESSDHQKIFCENLSFGGGCINDTVLHLANPHLPFGGVGHSGIGAYHGDNTFKTFSHQKSVLKQRTFFDLWLRYPPYSGKEKWVKRLLG